MNPNVNSPICILLNPTVDHICIVDDFHPGGTFKSDKEYIYPVGKAISVAIGLKVHNLDPRVIAFVGNDDLLLYKNFLSKFNIIHDLIGIDGKTRNNFTIIDRKSHNVTHVRNPGFCIEKPDIQRLWKKINLIKDSKVVISGSVPLGITNARIIRIIEMLTENGNTIFVDMSADALKELVHKGIPHVLKLNHIEVANLLGIKPDGIEIENSKNALSITDLKSMSAECQRLLKGNLMAIIMTMREMGAFFITKNEILHGHVEFNENIKSKGSSVGSGDAFFSGLIAGFENESFEKIEIQKALRVALATATASIHQFCPGIFDRQDYNSYIDKVHFKII